MQPRNVLMVLIVASVLLATIFSVWATLSGGKKSQGEVKGSATSQEALIEEIRDQVFKDAAP